MASQWISERPRDYDWPETLRLLHEACQAARASFERLDDAHRLLRNEGYGVETLVQASGTLMMAWIRLERVARPRFALWDAERYFAERSAAAEPRIVPVLPRFSRVLLSRGGYGI